MMDSLDIWERPLNLLETIVDEMYQILELHGTISSPETFCNKQLKVLQFFETRVNLILEDFLCVLDYVRQLENIPVKFYLTTQNSAYILLTLIILYLKMYDDIYYYNSLYVKWFKIKLTVLNETEYSLFRHLRLFGHIPRRKRKISDDIV